MIVMQRRNVGCVSESLKDRGKYIIHTILINWLLAIAAVIIILDIDFGPNDHIGASLNFNTNSFLTFWLCYLVFMIQFTQYCPQTSEELYKKIYYNYHEISNHVTSEQNWLNWILCRK